MAINQLLSEARYVKLPVAGATYSSGDPVALGVITGVAQSDKDADNNVVVDRFGSYDLSVKGIDDDGNSAVAIGDAIYFVSGDTPKLSKKSEGTLFGVALGTVGSSSTGTIEVLLIAGISADKLAGLTASTAELNKLTGAGAVLASGTTQAHADALKANYVLTDIDDNGSIDGTEAALVLNILAGAINAINDDLQDFKIRAGA